MKRLLIVALLLVSTSTFATTPIKYCIEGFTVITTGATSFQLIGENGEVVICGERLDAKLERLRMSNKIWEEINKNTTKALTAKLKEEF